MGIIYLLLLIFSVVLAIKYVRLEMQHQRRSILRIRTAVPRLVLMYKFMYILAKKPFTLLIISIVALSLLISGFSATPTSYIKEVNNIGGPTNTTVALISFTQPVNLTCGQLLSRLDIGSRYGNASCVTYLRMTLEEPFRINISKSAIYVVIGVPESLFRRIGGDDVFGIYAGTPWEGVKVLDLELPTGEVKTVRVRLVNEDFVNSLKIYGTLPLAPIESYIGYKPVTPPPKYILISSLSRLQKELGLGNIITDILVTIPRSLPPKAFIRELTTQTAKLPVKDIWVFSNGKTYVSSRVEVPTPSSIITASIAAGLAVLLSVSLFTSAIPYLKDIYMRMILQGLPPWAMSIVLLTYITGIVVVLSVTISVASYLYLGSISTLNILIASIIIWISLIVYANSAMKPPTLKSDVYIPPTDRYTLVSEILDIDTVAELIITSIKGNEFFTLEGLERTKIDGDVLIHARLGYNESWGSGIDLSIVVSPEEASSIISITSNIWSVEEISEAITRNMIALTLSRIVGVIKSWEEHISLK